MVQQGLPYSAVIAVNDLMAIELINHFKVLHVRVPEDAAVIGIDDVSKEIDSSLFDDISIASIRSRVSSGGIAAAYPC